MRFQRVAAILAASNALLGVSAGPLLAKRQDADESSSETASTTSNAKSVALAMSTMSDGRTTTFEVFAPQPTAGDSESSSQSDENFVTATPVDAESTLTYTPTGVPAAATSFPRCEDANARPFCLPLNGSELHVGGTYYVTWNPDFYPLNSTVIIKLQLDNDSTQQVWSSPKTKNSWGHVEVTMEKEWMQGYSMFNLTFAALNNDEEGDGKAVFADGPTITLKNAPPRHLPPSPTTKFHKEGLMIGLPIALAFVLIVVVGLYIGNRKKRTIGLGNIMGRHNRGYGTRKSKRQRLGLGKKGAIRLEEREVPQHTRADSLGSLISDDGIRPAPGNNHFRDEIERQRTGK